MSKGGAHVMSGNRSASIGGLREPRWVKVALISITLLLIGLFIVLPLIVVGEHAFRKGFEVFWAAISDDAALSAVKLTLTVALWTVPVNALFGIAAAWVLTKFQFRGKNILLTLIDLPFAVSPVIAGLIYVLMYGTNGWLGKYLDQADITVIFSTPGIVIATIFVTFPFVVRELMPLMQSQGINEEEAAVTLGASGWRVFWQVTLPNIKWALLYGIILCNARAMGEFGAVSVVSGHIRGETNTLPLHIEILYNEYHFVEAFAVSMLLVVLALITLIIKSIMEGWES